MSNLRGKNPGVKVKTYLNPPGFFIISLRTLKNDIIS